MSEARPPTTPPALASRGTRFAVPALCRTGSRERADDIGWEPLYRRGCGGRNGVNSLVQATADRDVSRRDRAVSHAVSLADRRGERRVDGAELPLPAGHPD